MILKVILLSFPCWSICHSLTTQQNCKTAAAFENIHYLKTQNTVLFDWALMILKCELLIFRDYKFIQKL